MSLNNCTLSNSLWPSFVDKIGMQKAMLAVRQSLDLQYMHGNPNTLPVLILETCGSALADNGLIRKYTGISSYGRNMILIYSSRLSSVQLLQELD